MNFNFDSVDSIVHFLQELPVFTPQSDSTAKSASDSPQSTKEEPNVVKVQRRKYTKSSDSSTSPAQMEGDIQILPKGRVRYGPVTVNPRKEPSKTLFTGRRSKYEVLSADEEERRRDRRERNRVAATKCREKRENVLTRLEREFREETAKNQQLMKLVGDLEQKKLTLESIVADHCNHCVLVNNANPTLDSTSSSMIFGGTDFLSSIIEAPAPPLPVNPPTLTCSEEEELSHMFEPNFLLTNSDYAHEGVRPDFISPQQYSFIMTSASLDRILNNLRSPTISMESANNSSSLFNSAPGVSCAKQYSGPGEDEALADAFLGNDYIC